jgi:hypothetical protein
MATTSDNPRPVPEALQAQIDQLQYQFKNAKGPAEGPGLIIDCLSPPFKTTIDDPAYRSGLP